MDYYAAVLKALYSCCHCVTDDQSVGLYNALCAGPSFATAWPLALTYRGAPDYSDL